MKKFLTVLFGSLLLLIPQKHSTGCLYYPMGEVYRFSIFHPGISNTDELSIFYFSSDYFNINLLGNDSFEEANITEWDNYFNHRYSKECIKTVVYSTDIYCLLDSSCNISLLQTCPGIRPVMNRNSQAGQYFYYMHECLGLLNDMKDPWYSDNYAIDDDAFERLIEKGSQLLKTFKNDAFLAKRTAYNLLRLYYYYQSYRRLYPDTLNEIYNQYFSRDTIASVIDGSAYFYNFPPTDNKAEMDYQLSKVFDFSIEKRQRAVELFSRENIPTVLAYAKNKHEKAVIHSMWLLQHPGKGLETLEKIYDLEPGCNYFNILLTREINKLEDWILTPLVVEQWPAVNTGSTSYYYGNIEDNFEATRKKNRIKDIQYLNQLILFINKLISTNSFKRKDLLNLYVCQLYLIKNDVQNADKYLNKAKNISVVTDKRFQIQLLINEIVIQIQTAGLNDNCRNLILKFHKTAKNTEDPHMAQLEKNLLLYIGNVLLKKR